MTYTIDELLNALKNPVKSTEISLENNKDTWSRINRKDSFSELGLKGSALDDFLKEWISNNPYNNI